MGQHRVYYFSRVLEGGARGFWTVNREARHAGVIIDDPEKGLVKIELLYSPEKGPQLNIQKIDEFHRQTNSNKGRWCYKIGKTNLNYEEIVMVAQKWMSNHQNYNVFNNNCRSFADALIITLVEVEDRAYSISESKFKESPCEAAEHNIKNCGFNVPTYVYPKHRIEHRIAARL